MAEMNHETRRAADTSDRRNGPQSSPAPQGPAGGPAVGPEGPGRVRRCGNEICGMPVCVGGRSAKSPALPQITTLRHTAEIVRLHFPGKNAVSVLVLETASPGSAALAPGQISSLVVRGTSRRQRRAVVSNITAGSAAVSEAYTGGPETLRWK